MATYDASHDDFQNNLIATGALIAVLGGQVPVATVLSVEGLPDGAGNQIDVRFPFLKSPYRLTIERVDEPEGQ